MTPGILLAIVSAIAFGAAMVFAGLGLRGVKPLQGTLVSLVLSWPLAFIVCLVFQYKALTSLSPTALGWLAIIGLLSFVLGRGFSFMGIKHIGASRSSTVYSSYPIFTILLAIPFLGERASPLIISGTVMITGGLVFLFSERGADKANITAKDRLVGYGFALASAISYGGNVVLIKWVVSKMAPPLVTVAVSIFFATLALSVVAGKGIIPTMRNNPRSTGFLALSGISMTLGAIAFYTALRMAPAVVVTPLGITSALFTLMGTYFFLQKLEKVNVHVVIGCVAVVIGGILVTRG